jgi:hypothetical protein
MKESVNRRQFVSSACACSAFVAAATTSLAVVLGAGPVDFPKLEGPYLGQKPPGMTPQRFAPGVVSTDQHEHSRLEISRDGKELYWAVIPVEADRSEGGWSFLIEQQSIWFSKNGPDGWSRPQILLPGRWVPTLSTDGQTLYCRPIDRWATPDDLPEERKKTVLAASRTPDGWSTPVAVEGLLPEDGRLTASFCFARNGNLYFDSGEPTKSGNWTWELFVAKRGWQVRVAPTNRLRRQHGNHQLLPLGRPGRVVPNLVLSSRGSVR